MNSQYSIDKKKEKENHLTMTMDILIILGYYFKTPF